MGESLLYKLSHSWLVHIIPHVDRHVWDLTPMVLVWIRRKPKKILTTCWVVSSKVKFPWDLSQGLASIVSEDSVGYCFLERVPLNTLNTQVVPFMVVSPHYSWVETPLSSWTASLWSAPRLLGTNQWRASLPSLSKWDGEGLNFRPT